MRSLRAIDLCCGAGGWACAARDLPIEWVAVVDIAEDCLETWRLNHRREHPSCAVLNRDLSKPGSFSRLRNFLGQNTRIDLIVGGIPCEELSIARATNPPTEETMDRWHDLLDNVLTFVRDLAPPWWAIEDVIQIKKHLPLPLWHGEEVPHQTLNSAAFSAQSRQRTFLGRFPTPDPAVAYSGPRSLVDCLLPGPYATEPNVDQYQPTPAGHNRSRVGNEFYRLLDPGEKSPAVMGGLDRGSRQRRAFMTCSPSGIPRRLTWQECARLQGFPTDYVFAGNAGRIQKMVGQAIQIDLGREILRGICAEAENQGRASA